MKNTKKHFRTLSILSIFLLLIHCTKDTNLNCETCHVNKPNEITNINLLKRDLQFDKYSSEGQALSSFNVSYSQNLKDLITANNITIDGYDLSKINNANLAGIVTFSDAKGEEIDLSHIDRIIFYIKESNGFRTFLFKNETDGLVLKTEFSFHTNYFASNDIYDFQTISAPKKQSNAYIVLNKNLISPFNVKESDLQLFLNKNRPYTSSIGSSDCYQPCDSGEGVCVVTGGGNNWDGDWLCSTVVAQMEEEQPICNEKRVSKTINNETNFPATDILFTSYNFKYSFLENSPKGQQYIEMYYEMSKQMNTKSLNYEFAVQTYNTIKDHLLPICRELMNNSKSQSILITEDRHAVLLKRINNLETELNNPDATKILNIVRNDLNAYRNKSVSFVFNSFKQ
ncbi:hypothetical protein [Chryseobacterium scophthalmum]|uniref:hypothetical protein n=1 Tax=Chryseobacterium scophthalmum TaxID=59733 RepID=UPI003D06F157